MRQRRSDLTDLFSPKLSTTEVGWYSTDADLNFDSTDQKLRYFNQRNFNYGHVAFDLNAGLDGLSLYEKNLNLKNILKWIGNNRNR